MKRHVVVALWLVSALTASCAADPNARPTLSSTPIVAPSATVPPATTPTPAATSTPQVSSGTVTVDAGDHFFSPARITVAVGATVVWRVVGQSTHDVVAADGSFASSVMTFGGTFSHTFTKPGRYPYLCTPHAGDGMIGEVVVE